MAILSFLHYHRLNPKARLSPNVAVVDPLRREALRAIALNAGFSRREINRLVRIYLAAYDPLKGEKIEEATQKAERWIAQRLPRVTPGQIERIFTLPDVLEEFGQRLKAILKGFGLTFQSGTLTDEAINALYQASQA